MAKQGADRRRNLGGKSAIVQHVESLVALDLQFRRFDAKLRAAIQEHPELKPLEIELDRTREAVRIPAFGMEFHKLNRR